MLVTDKTLNNVTFKSNTQQVIQQTRIKILHKCNLINTCNRINNHQSNKPVVNRDRVKYHQPNKSKTGTITKSYKMDS